MVGVWLVAVVSAMAFAVSGCIGEAGRTFEPGVEHLPAPASLVVRLEPPGALDDRQIVLTSYDDQPTVVFPSQRGADRFLSGTTLPSTLIAWVDGARCAGSIELLSEMEVDATLTIDRNTCSLLLDLRHRMGAIEHGLEDIVPGRS